MQHHCRACGKVVCGRCSGNRSTSNKRVCDVCFAVNEPLSDAFPDSPPTSPRSPRSPLPPEPDA